MFVQVAHGNVDSRRDEIFIQPQSHQIVNKRRSTSTADVDVFNNNKKLSGNRKMIKAIAAVVSNSRAG
jgi:hypothetical protein